MMTPPRFIFCLILKIQNPAPIVESQQLFHNQHVTFSAYANTRNLVKLCNDFIYIEFPLRNEMNPVIFHFG